MKKVLSIVLSILMILSACVVAFAREEYTPSAGYSDYTGKKESELTNDDIASVVLDYVDRLLKAKKSEFNTFETSVLGGSAVNTELQADTVDGLLRYVDYFSVIGGDFASLDVSALNKTRAADGDGAVIYAVIQFVADNAATFAKLFQWKSGKTFNFGKVGTYIENNLAGSEIQKFYTKYLKNGYNIQSALINEIASEMDYTPASGEAVDDIIDNGIKDVVTGMLGDVLSADAVAQIKNDSNINLKTQDIYTAVQKFFEIVINDLTPVIATYYRYYLDNALRPALKAAYGYNASVAAAVASNSSTVVSAFNSAYDADTLKKIASSPVIYQYNSKCYSMTVSNGTATQANAITWEGGYELTAPMAKIYTYGTGSSAVTLSYGGSTYKGKSIREYYPRNENITVNVYTPFRDQVTDATLSALIKGTDVPASYSSLISGATNVSGIKNFVGAAVYQDDVLIDGSTVVVKLSDIKTTADTAAKNAAKAAAQGFVDALSAGGIEFLSSPSVGTPTVTAAYNGYATADEFIATYKPSVTETVSVWVNTSAGDYTIQGTIDLVNKKLVLTGDVLSMLGSNVTGPAVRSLFSSLGMPIGSDNNADITKLLRNSAYDATKDAVTVVFDDLSGGGGASGAAELENYINSDFVIDPAVVTSDLISNYTQYLGIVGQANHILKQITDMLLTDAGKTWLGLTDAKKNTSEFDDNIAKISSKAKTLVSGLTDFATSAGFSLDDFSAGIANDLLWKIDFSSVEKLVSTGIAAILGVINPNDGSTLAKIASAVKNDKTMDNVAKHVISQLIPVAVGKFNDMLDGSGYTYSYATNASRDFYTQITDFGVNVLEFLVGTVANGAVNKFIDSFNKVAGVTGTALEIADVDLKLGATYSKSAGYLEKIGAVADRILAMTDGLMTVDAYDASDVLSKASAVANVLPLGSLFSNAASPQFSCDFNKIKPYFDDALNGKLEGVLSMFLVNNGTNKDDDVAYDVTVTFALINAAAHIAGHFFPNAILASRYYSVSQATVLNYFTGSDSVGTIAAATIADINSKKTTLLPAVFGIANDMSLVRAVSGGRVASDVTPVNPDNPGDNDPEEIDPTEGMNWFQRILYKIRTFFQRVRDFFANLFNRGD